MKKIGKEFKEFISRGNVMNLAVGVIIGSAFTAIVNSLVNDIFLPLLGLVTGGLDFKSLSIPLGSGEDAAALNYGAFISAIINFLLIALVIFFLVKGINRLSGLTKKEKEEVPAAPTVKTCPYCKSEVPVDAVKCKYCASELETAG